MDNNVTIHKINDTTRIRVDYDYGVECPVDNYGNDIGIFTLTAGHGIKILSNSIDDHNLRLANIQYNSSNLQEALDRHFTRAGMNYKIVHLQGYCQSEWAEVVMYSTMSFDVIDSYVDELKQWWKGDVYILTIETEVTYVNTNNSNDTHTHWEITDSISGIYIDPYDTDKVIDEASQHFMFELQNN